jgi:acetyltransferase-like isoleucine patch superfamily enzyme
LLTQTTSKLFVRLLRFARRGSLTNVDANISATALLREFVFRLIALIRSQWALRGVYGSRLRFAERNIEIRHRRRCHAGRGCSIEAYVRLHCLGQQGVVLGDNVTIGRSSIIECTGILTELGVGVEIGNGSALGDFCYIGGAGGVTIGSGVLLGQRVSIHSQNHNYADPERPIASQGTSQRGVEIGADCWIGSGAIILDGVHLGAGSVVAAGAVVTRSFAPGSVVAGVPGRLIRDRDDGEREAPPVDTVTDQRRPSAQTGASS